ncbi:hypothetical protein JRO89_XS10G0001700 [Xanthoceras sorbifolium]|uniref:Uncharacterized protein n=1 Tax=Xanthoceras sorbifolium TaxID=99658 RepID=A0ABQ8HGY6_9ROSI|nr:hypothetical protein JRO89_XS10G0001700 [Xanthoceras sorbifolium]
MEVGSANWHKINWGAGKFSGTLPPAPPRQQLMDRYWSHVVNRRSCSRAYKILNALEVILQVISIVSIGIAAVTKQSEIPMTENCDGIDGCNRLCSFKMVGSFHL